MKIISLISGCVLIPVIALGVGDPRVRSQSTAQAIPAPTKYSQDARGLEEEFEPFIAAHELSDTTAGQKLAIFTLPDPSGWFAKYFAGDQVQQLAEDDARELTRYEKGLTNLMNFWPNGTRFQVQCKESSGSGPQKVQPRPDAILPVSPVPLEKFEITFVADNISARVNGRTFTQLGNFVYVDGAYRFMGLGAYPFWAQPRPSPKN